MAGKRQFNSISMPTQTGGTHPINQLMPVNLANLAEVIRSWIFENRRSLFFVFFGTLALWLLMELKEISSLLILSYLIALLMEPGVAKLARWRVPRPAGVLTLIIGFILGILIFLFVLIPPVVKQYSQLLEQLPLYVEKLAGFVRSTLSSTGLVEVPNLEDLVILAKESVRDLSPEQLKKFFNTLLGVLLEGYSVTLLIFNLTLLPFFVFYLSVDLNRIHSACGEMLSETTREKIGRVSKEVMDQIHAFIKGQFTVSGIMAVMYAAGLALIGVPSGLAIGFLSGILNIIPYFGVIVGMLLSVGAVLISEPGWLQILLVLLVFGVVQSVESMLLTPKIVGDRTGIPPLGVMVALLAGAQLLGFIGIVIAIPIAAAGKVIFNFAWREVHEDV